MSRLVWGPNTLGTARVPQLPPCQFHERCTAQYDFRTNAGPWAYGCHAALVTYRMDRLLGMGKGQFLVTPDMEIPARFRDGQPVCSA